MAMPARLGEIRALTWGDVDLDVGTLTVRRLLLPDGTPKAPKTAAGTRTVPLLLALRRLLVEWKLRSPRAAPDELIVRTADGGHVRWGAERALWRVRRQYSGQTGDYVAWATIGVALLAGLSALAT